MILVDTSVFINFLRGREPDPLTSIIENGIPFGICGYVYLELLQGAKTMNEMNILKDYLSSIPMYGLSSSLQSLESAALINFRCRKAGITIRSTVDCLIAQTAIENNLELLHDDSDFDNMAKAIPQLRVRRA